MTNYHTPAFPNAKVIINGLDEQDGVSGYSPGMTLLDHFAGLAMQGAIAGMATRAETLIYKECAGLAYEMALAMLEEREKWIK